MYKTTNLFMLCLISLVMMVGVASADLVGHWKLDEMAGEIAADSSGQGNDGVFHGNPQWVEGFLRGAIELNGDDYIAVPDYDALHSDQYTAAAWVKIPIAQAGNYSTWVVAKGVVGGAGGYGLAIQGQEPTAYQENGTTWYRVFSGIEIELNEWHHIAATYDGTSMGIYVDGVLGNAEEFGFAISPMDLLIGVWNTSTRFYTGTVDDVQIYNEALNEEEIQQIMSGLKVWPYASAPTPKDGTLHSDTWVSLSWRPGGLAASHDVYIGDNFDDVNEGTRDSEVFRGNITDTFLLTGIAGYPYPDGLVNGTTYYWRVDEVNEADPNSPWKGDVWSFMIPPKTAYDPVPADGAEFVDLNVKLTWTAGFNAKLHYVVFGEDFDVVNNTAMGRPNGPASYNPGSLKLAKTYYWRVDEYDGAETHKGEVWSFTTLGAVSGPNPADGAVDVEPSVVLGWDAGAVAASHEVYFGTDADAVANATTASPEYKGPKALGEESYDPGILTLNTTYYWRIVEVNAVSPDSPWAGNVWSFTTGDFFVIDDFETYDANDNQIWYAWHDGLGAGSPGTSGYIPPNGTGSAVGDETTASYTEEAIVHGGNQSMPLVFNNNQQGYAYYSEVEYTLPDQRDWTADGVTELSLWLRGYPGFVGSFTAAPTGTITMTGSGADVWGTADQFHFAYKTLTGAGSIVAKVESVQNTNVWAKAGVMIRETLDAGSKHAFAAVTPSNGVASQGRTNTDAASFNMNQTGITAPHWVKLERSITGTFTVSHSANGSTWEPVTSATPQNISMASNVYIGLALSSHDIALTCQAVFSNVTTTGNVSGQWTNQDIGITSNDAEPLYVAVSNTAGTSAVVVHDDPAVSQIGIWTPWIIPLQAFADKGIVLTNVDRIAIGLGTKGNMTIPGGSGKMYIDDVRLYPLPVKPPDTTSSISIAGAYTNSDAPVSLPQGWEYLYSDAASGGAEVALDANTAIGNAGNTGFGGPAMFSTPAVLGTVSGENEFQIFGDGFAGHAGVVGDDLLLHPGNTAETAFVIVRYTVSEADIVDGNVANIAGSFRDLAGGTTGGGANSITADIYLNDAILFSATGAEGRLFQADGTFDLTDVAVAAGDTISFVVGNNGGFGGDETALEGMISF